MLSTYTVINTDDAGPGSLRDAVDLANANAGADDIVFDPGVSGTITLSSGELEITDDLTIAGPGAAVLTVSGDDVSRIFRVNDGTPAAIAVAISAVTLTEGQGAGSVGGAIINAEDLTLTDAVIINSEGTRGGGIFNQSTGTLALSGCTVSNNGTTGGFGGGIYNGGTLTLIDSVISGNESDGGGGLYNGGTATVTGCTISSNLANSGPGGGVFNQNTLTLTNSTLSENSADQGGGLSSFVTLTLTDSTLSGNSAGNYGGGVFATGMATLTNVTLSGNSASYGGGIYVDRVVTLTSSTLSGNTASVLGGGLYNNYAATLNNTIVANSVAGDDVVNFNGATLSGDHNLIETLFNDSSSSSTNNLTNTITADPNLGPLANNGGPTLTHELLPGSPAIDAGNNALAVGLVYDQRGPGYPRIVGGTVDIGSFEVQSSPQNGPPTAEAGGPYTVVAGGSVTLDGSASTDPDQPGSTLTYEWDLDGDNVFGETGPAAGRGDEIGAMPTFSAAGLNAGSSVTVVLRVTDDGGLTSTDTATITVVAVATRPDVCDPTRTELAIGGTTGNDTIVITPVGGSGAVKVTVNGVSQGTFTPTGRIVVYAQAGDDDVQVAGSIGQSAWLFGDGGDDRLKGGNGNDVLVGGPGADLVAGGSGRDLLIGGTGADRIVGNADDDIIVAGSTAHDAHEEALCAILDEWTSTRSYATRVANIRDGTGSATRENEVYFLDVDGPDATVYDDAIEDVLTGSSGIDWFFANLDVGVRDKVADLHAAEFADDLDFLAGP